MGSEQKSFIDWLQIGYREARERGENRISACAVALGVAATARGRKKR